MRFPLINLYALLGVPFVLPAAAMEKAVETAYKAVMKPKEGTILTVAREAAVKAAEIAEESANLELFFRAIFEHAEKTLARTPEMLPVLKEAGVVDSGGQGLLEVFRGAFDGYLGKEIDYSAFEKVLIAGMASGMRIFLYRINQMGDHGSLVSKEIMNPFSL